MIVHVLYPAVDHPTARFVNVGEEDIEIPESLAPEDLATFLAESAFAHWNNGSGTESDEFRAAEIRSLSTGDVVHVPALGIALKCKSLGWQETLLGDHEICKKGEAVIGFQPFD